jgi:UDP-N-acetylmuramoyl-L-alanyl-D-glutamate--2,6-diaminopimelate ligase
MADYFAAKRRLFTERLAADGRRVLASGDPWSARLAAAPRDGDLSWGLADGDVRATAVSANLEGTHFTLVLPGIQAPVRLRLVGEHNLANALAAAAAAHALDVPAEAIRAGLEAARPLTGRLERVEVELPFPVFVDYAHTPEGLRTVLSSLRRLSDRRLLVVFGAGGDRDPGKRGPMGAAVGELADLAIVTSDNPRSEDPAAIAAAVAAGVRAAGREPVVELDRRRAIALALTRADESSLVLVAGKGHEAVQTIGDRVLPFSDHEVIRDEARRTPCG